MPTPNQTDPYAAYGGKIADDPYKAYGGSVSAPAAEPPSAISRFFSGAADEVGGFLRAGYDMVKPTSIEDAANKLANPGGMLADNLVVKPTVQKAKSAIAAAKEGDYAKAALGAAATLNPLAPDVTKLYDQAASGDTAGAAGRGAVQAGALLLGTEPATKLLSKPANAVMGAVEDTAVHPVAVAGKAIRAAVPSPLSDTLTKPRGTIPAEAATPLELKDYADANGIRVNAAQLTEHNFPRNVQSAGERATVNGTLVRQQTAAAQADVTAHANKLMDSMSPATDSAAAGAAAQDSARAALDKARELNSALYDKVDSLAESLRAKVDFRPLKEAAQESLNDSFYVRERVPGLDPKRAAAILKSITQLPDRGSFGDAQAIRSGLIDEASHPDNVMSEQAQGWFKRLTGVADEGMEKAASGDPDLLGAWRRANEAYKQLQEDFNSPRSPLYQALKEPDPNKVPQKFSAKGALGGSPFNPQLLDKYGIDKGPIQRMVMQDMLSKDFRLFSGKMLAGYSDNFLRALYTPEQLDAIYKTGALARSVSLQSNPSGTAVVQGAMQDLQKPVRSLLPKALAAKLTTSPGFNDWLMTPAKDLGKVPARDLRGGGGPSGSRFQAPVTPTPPKLPPATAAPVEPVASEVEEARTPIPAYLSAPTTMTVSRPAPKQPSFIDVPLSAPASVLKTGMGLPAPGSVGEMLTSEINSDPHTYQYKGGTDAQGVSPLLKEVGKFDRNLAGTISVWLNPEDGKVYVVNGHHRLELAQRTGAKTMNVLHIEAPNAKTARAIGAMQNIAEGRGTPIDAAKFMRDTGYTIEDMKRQGLPAGEAMVEKGAALARLDDSLFNQVVQGEFPQDRAIEIAKATDDPVQQRGIVEMIKQAERRGSTVTKEGLREYVRRVQGAETTTQSTPTLFGLRETTHSLALEEAEISAYVKQQLAKDKRVFGFVANEGRATELERGNNRIDVKASKELASRAMQGQELYDRLSSRAGPITDALRSGARRLGNEENPAAVKRETYAAIYEELRKALP